MNDTDARKPISVIHSTRGIAAEFLWALCSVMIPGSISPVKINGRVCTDQRWRPSYIDRDCGIPSLYKVEISSLLDKRLVDDNGDLRWYHITVPDDMMRPVSTWIAGMLGSSMDACIVDAIERDITRDRLEMLSCGNVTEISILDLLDQSRCMDIACKLLGQPLCDIARFKALHVTWRYMNGMLVRSALQSNHVGDRSIHIPDISLPPSRIPQVIIKYEGGAAGDFLRSICMSQVEQSADVFNLNDSGRIPYSGEFKVYHDVRVVNTYIRPPDLEVSEIENTHVYSEELHDTYKAARWYYIDIPDACAISIAKCLVIKLGLQDYKGQDDRRFWANRLLRNMDRDDDMASHIVRSRRTSKQFLKVCYSKGIRVIPFLDIIDEDRCAKVVRDIINGPLRDADLFKRQHRAWREKNDWFLAMLADDIRGKIEFSHINIDIPRD